MSVSSPTGAPTNALWQSPTSSYIETTKTGGYDILVNGLNHYINFNSISGASGYGFRDNAGTMEFKSSGGSWDSFVGQDTLDDTKEPTGFIQTLDNLPPASSTISFDNGTRTFTIEPSLGFDDFSFWVLGEKFTKTSADTIQISDVEGEHYIYYDTDGTLKDSTTSTELNFTILPFRALVAILYWDKTNQQIIYFGEERHFNSMSGSTHTRLHLVSGTQFISGSAIKDIDTDQSGDLAAHAQFGTEAGEMRDEDRRDVAGGIAAVDGMPVFYKLNAGGDWRRDVNAGFPILTTGTGRMAWNEFTGGAWQLTEVANGDFALAHVFQINDTIINDAHIVVMGQGDYANIIAARDGATTEINNLVTTGLPFAEFVPIATIIYQTSNGYANAVKSRTRTTDLGTDYIDWRFSGLSPSVTSVNSHLVLTDLNGGDGVGNHTNAANLLGRSGGQTLIGGTGAGDDLTFQTTSDAVKGSYILSELGTGIIKSTLGVLSLAVAGTDYEVPLTFSGSLVRAINDVSLDGDSVTPGNSKYYGTDGGGTKGFFDLPTSAVWGSITGTLSDQTDLWTELGNKLENIVEDTTPQLGGTLDAQENDIDNVGDIIHDDATASDFIIKNTDQDKDLSLQVNVNGTQRTLVFLDGSERMVGINTTSPTVELDVAGQFKTQKTFTDLSGTTIGSQLITTRQVESAATGTTQGGKLQTFKRGDGDYSGVIEGFLGLVGLQSGAGDVADARGARYQIQSTTTDGGNIIEAKTLYLQNPFITGNGNITTIYGLYIDDMSTFTGGGSGSIGTCWSLYIDGNCKNYIGGTVKIGGTAVRATTEGTKHLDIFDGTAPVGTLANGISLYSTSGELRVMDAAGNATLLSPHDKETNEWIYDSVDTTTGKHLRIDMEKMMRAINKKFGWDFVKEFTI